MQGAKIRDARRAILDLIDRLTPRDRLALISYAEGVRRHFTLLPVDGDNRPFMKSAVRQLSTGGGTNLGAGNYYYLDQPAAFAEVFQKEFYLSRNTVATGITVFVPLAPGVQLVNASGYPLNHNANGVRFHTGSLAAGRPAACF